jgi:hypothetical protein
MFYWSYPDKTAFKLFLADLGQTAWLQCECCVMKKVKEINGMVWVYMEALQMRVERKSQLMDARFAVQEKKSRMEVNNEKDTITEKHRKEILTFKNQVDQVVQANALLLDQRNQSEKRIRELKHLLDAANRDVARLTNEVADSAQRMQQIAEVVDHNKPSKRNRK